MSMPTRFALRDLGLLLVTHAIWWADAHLHQEASVLAGAIAVAAGGMAALCGFLLHEWGHLLGALLKNARVSYPARLTSPFLFMFDVGDNGRSEFLAMSCGGYAASALGIAVLLVVLPAERLSGQVGLVAACLGTLGVLIGEVPTTYRVYIGKPLPQRGPAYVGGGEDDGPPTR